MVLCGTPPHALRVLHDRDLRLGAALRADNRMGLARQHGNEVTLSYRKEAFSRLKNRNVKRIREMTDPGKQ